MVSSSNNYGRMIVRLAIVFQGCQVVESRARAAKETRGGEEEETDNEEGRVQTLL